MSFYKIKQRGTDGLWRKYIRIKQKFTCQKCGRVYPSDDSHRLMNLEVAHFWGRGNENTRFDEENCVLLCGIPCHQYFDTHKTEFTAFMKKRLGRKRFDLLALRAHIIKKRDDKADRIIIKQMLKEIGE